MSVTKITYRSDTAAGDDANIGFTSAEGLILTGQGSTNDVTIKNDADADVLKIPTGTTGVTIANGLTLTDGDVTVASGHGINFAATADATGMASELLSDYEEGVYTPTVTGSSSGNYALSTGDDTFAYTRVGRMVTVNGLIQTATDNSISGNIQFSLPFTSSNSLTDNGEITVGSVLIEANGTSISNNLNSYITANVAFFTVLLGPTDGGDLAVLDQDDVDAVFNLYVGITYLV